MTSRRGRSMTSVGRRAVSRIGRAGRRLVDRAPPGIGLAVVDAVESRLGEAELRLLPALVRPGEAAADIGANRGLYARRLAPLCPLVLAFEPQPWLAARLTRATPGNVLVLPIGLGNTAGEATLMIPRVGSATVHTRATFRDTGADHVDQTVLRLRLDDLGLGSLGFAKIDVEGHEREVLEGAVQTLERCRPRLLVECDVRTGAHPAEVLERLSPLGYEGWFHHRGDIVPLTGFDAAVHQAEQKQLGCPHPGDLVVNFMFLPSSDAGAVTAALRARIGGG